MSLPIPGVSGKTVSSRVEAAHTVSDVRYIPSRRDLIADLLDTVKPGDLLITQGAGRRHSDWTNVYPRTQRASSEPLGPLS